MATNFKFWSQSWEKWMFGYFEISYTQSPLVSSFLITLFFVHSEIHVWSEQFTIWSCKLLCKNVSEPKTKCLLDPRCPRLVSFHILLFRGKIKVKKTMIFSTASIVLITQVSHVSLNSTWYCHHPTKVSQALFTFSFRLHVLVHLNIVLIFS